MSAGSSVPSRDDIRVALVLATVGDLSGSGGAERQFGDLFDYLRRRGSNRVELVTSRAAVERLREADRLGSSDGLIALPLGSRPAGTKLGIAWLTLALLWTTLRRRWDVVHICQPTPSYVPFVALLSWLPKAMRPRVALTVVDCTLAPNLISGEIPDDVYERQVIEAHRMYFRWTRLDGVFSWYEAFTAVATSLQLAPGVTLASAKYCFTDPNRFQPGIKQRLVVFAGRLSMQKRPLLFVDAIAALLRRYATLASGWRFVIYGSGPLEREVRSRIEQLGIAHAVEVTHAVDMAPVFAASALFVSTQAYENFTSLAMLEAMAAGNAIVAERIGQTDQFVRDGENGILATPATADAFADAIAEYLSHPEQHAAMAQASRRIATSVHTLDHFAADIGMFWRKLLAA